MLRTSNVPEPIEMPEGFWGLMGKNGVWLRVNYNISPKAIKNWTTCVATGKLPTLNAQGDPHEFKTAQEFQEHVAPFLEKFITGGKDRKPW